MFSEMFDPVAYSLRRGEAALSGRTDVQRKSQGQFLTPAPIARFMAQRLGGLSESTCGLSESTQALGESVRVLDPAIGSGVLACAVIERAVKDGRPARLHIEGCETDSELHGIAVDSLETARLWAANQGITVSHHIEQHDFLEHLAGLETQSLFSLLEPTHPVRDCDYIISNPPYFKLNLTDERTRMIQGQLKGHTNIYTVFMALAMRLLSPAGRACFIVPRSFCSGSYFADFRRDFMERVVPLNIHLFESRQDAFKKDTVLQENIIITFQPAPAGGQAEFVELSVSQNGSDLAAATSRRITTRHFIARHNGDLFFRLPVSELDDQIVQTIDQWPGALGQYGLDVSTGPVVAFRAQTWLISSDAVMEGQGVPLLWLHNVRAQTIHWPVTENAKLQGVSAAAQAAQLLVPNANYVILRRFSAKEDARRLVAAPLLRASWDYPFIGLENHLNFIYRKSDELSVDEAAGLSALYNSALVDRYFRVSNGNTQVNATELRALPLPPLEVIRAIGRRLAAHDPQSPPDINAVVFDSLRTAGYLSPDIPTIWETRITMM